MTRDRRVDCFFDIVRDERNRFLFALPDAHPIGAHSFRSQEA